MECIGWVGVDVSLNTSRGDISGLSVTEDVGLHREMTSPGPITCHLSTKDLPDDARWCLAIALRLNVASDIARRHGGSQLLTISGLAAGLHMRRACCRKMANTAGFENMLGW